MNELLIEYERITAIIEICSAFLFGASMVTCWVLSSSLRKRCISYSEKGGDAITSMIHDPKIAKEIEQLWAADKMMINAAAGAVCFIASFFITIILSSTALSIVKTINPAPFAAHDALKQIEVKQNTD